MVQYETAVVSLMNQDDVHERMMGNPKPVLASSVDIAKNPHDDWLLISPKILDQISWRKQREMQD